MTVADRTAEFMQPIDAAQYEIAGVGDGRPGRDALISVAERHGVPLPEEFIAHATAAWSGLYLAVRPEIWPRAGQYAVGPFWTFLHGLHTYTLGDGIPDWVDLDKRTTAFQTETGLTAMPVLRIIGDADEYCVDAAGDIAQWRHETNELEPVGGGFFDLLGREIRNLDERREAMVSQRRS